MPTRPTTYRPPFAPARTRDVRPSAAVRGYDRQWARLRRQHLAANPLCVLCLEERRTVPATVADHRVPIAVDPSRRLDPSNVRSLCVTHHNQCTANFRTTGVNEPPEPTTTTEHRADV